MAGGENMTTVSVRQAQRYLSSLIEQVQQGDCVVITRRGIPVATLAPVRNAEHVGKTSRVIEELKNLRRGVRLQGVSIRELIEEGRD